MWIQASQSPGLGESGIDTQAVYFLKSPLDSPNLDCPLKVDFASKSGSTWLGSCRVVIGLFRRDAKRCVPFTYCVLVLHLDTLVRDEKSGRHRLIVEPKHWTLARHTRLFRFFNPPPNILLLSCANPAGIVTEPQNNDNDFPAIPAIHAIHASPCATLTILRPPGY